MESRITDWSLSGLFAVEKMTALIQRMSYESDRYSDAILNHPLRQPILAELGPQIATRLSSDVIRGEYRPEEPKFCWLSKRRGGSREAVFLSLVDSIVGRRIAFILDQATHDFDFQLIEGNNHQVLFSGRSHAGDAEEETYPETKKWFQYRNQVNAVAAMDGFAYVLETDLADFYPSIDRDQAKGAVKLALSHDANEFIDLTFMAIGGWTPVFQYSRMMGLQIENNDVSRMIAHIYVRPVDEVFKAETGTRYFRYVDDTTIVVSSSDQAEALRLKHQKELRKLGLSPNAGKTRIVPSRELVCDTKSERHHRLDNPDCLCDEALYDLALEAWNECDKRVGNGEERVLSRCFNVARTRRFIGLQSIAESALAEPLLIQSAALYCLTLNTTDGSRTILQTNLDASQVSDFQVRSAQYLSDLPFSRECSEEVGEYSISRLLLENNDKDECSLLFPHLLFTAFKHARNSLLPHLSRLFEIHTMDEASVLTLAYIAIAEGQTGQDAVRQARRMTSKDAKYALWLLDAIRNGELENLDEILKVCFGRHNATSWLPSKHVSLFRMLCGIEPYIADCRAAWAGQLGARNGDVALLELEQLLS